MIDFATDPVTGDISLAGGQISAETDQDEIDRLRLKRYLELYRGEWFQDLDAGVPWGEVLGQPYREVVVRSVIATGARDLGFALVSSSIVFDGATRGVAVDGRFRRADGTEFDLAVTVQ